MNKKTRRNRKKGGFFTQLKTPDTKKRKFQEYDENYEKQLQRAISLEKQQEQLNSLEKEDMQYIRFMKCLKRSLTSNEECSFDSDKMISEYSSKNISDIIFENMDTKLRSVIEPLTASKQCMQTIGKCGNPCICWLCGNKIKPETDSIHCDHVLPIIRAIMFSAIKSTKKIENRNEFEPEKLNQYLMESYNYAHGLCNIKKSDAIMIKMGTSSIVYDEEEGLALARKIYDVIPYNLPKNKELWIKEQSKKYREKIEKLLVPINKEIELILSIEGTTMETYLKYTMQIMKSYSAETSIRLYAHLTDRQKEHALTIMGNNEHALSILENENEHEKEKAHILKEEAIQTFAEFRKQRHEELSQIKRKLFTKNLREPAKEIPIENDKQHPIKMSKQNINKRRLSDSVLYTNNTYKPSQSSQTP